MYRMGLVIVLFIGLLIAFGSHVNQVRAQGVPVPVEAPVIEMQSLEAVRALTRQFMVEVSAERFDAAFNLISPVSNLNGEQYRVILTSTIEKYPNLIKAYGVSKGYDLLMEVPMGESLVRMVYIDKLMNYPVRWEFIYYKSDMEWRLISISWNTRIKELMEQVDE